MQTDVQQTARTLTKAQRRAIMALDAVEFVDWKRVYRQRRQRMLMHAKGLHEPYRQGPVTLWAQIRLTPFGVAVREHLERTAHAD